MVAADNRPERLGRLLQNLSRLGHANVFPLVADGRRPPVRAVFNRVLVDVPCTGTGILSRRPEIRWRRRPADIATLAQLQFELLKAAAETVQRRGILVYSTCSLEPEENEGVVERFLEELEGDFRLSPARDLLPSEVVDPKTGSYLATLPHRHRCDGAFAARLHEAASAAGTEAAQTLLFVAEGEVDLGRHV